MHRNLFLLLIFGFFLTAVVQAQNHSVRESRNFDDGWKFHLGNAKDPLKDFHYGFDEIFAKTGDPGETPANPDFVDSSWTNVTLPHDWVEGLPFVHKDNGDLESHGYKAVGPLFPENSIGWYRKTFVLQKVDSGNRLVLTFDGIFRDCTVWINGYYLGSNLSGYSGVSFDLTDFLHYGRQTPNVVTIRADASQYEGWFYEGAGIYRHAWLQKFNNLHLVHQGGVFVYTDVTGMGTATMDTTALRKAATVHIKATLVNQGIDPATATVETYLTDREGKMLAQASPRALSLAVDAEGSIDFVLPRSLSTPRLWSLSDPYLYRAVVLVRQDDKVIDSVKVRFGVRTITVDKDQGLFLNGQSIKVQGVCCHQDHAGVGSALPDYLQYYRIRLLQEMGVNAYRTSHNPPTPELLDACDSLGMLVLDETRLLDSGPEYEEQFRKLLLRDRNHPSVFMWSIGNEEWVAQETDIGKRIAQHQILLAAQLDPTRLCTEACNFGNGYTGVNEVLPVRGFNYHLDEVDAYHHDHPTQPVIGTETASTVTTRGIYRIDTVNDYVPDYDSTHPSWATTAEYWWTIAANRPWFMGGFAWTGFDYRGEPTPYSWPNINSHFGIMDVCGFPKNIYYYYQSWWTDKDVLHIAPHWNWKGKEGQPIKVWVNSNADAVELFLNGKSLGKKTMPRQGHLNWVIPYHPGKLSATAYKEGRTFKGAVETTGAPYTILLTPDRTNLTADGKDATVINVTVKDEKGREVPDAMNLIHFTLAGPGRLIGAGNGDPSSHEADQCSDGQWQRSLFNGKCQIIVQSNKEAEGNVQIRATGDGLQGSLVYVLTQQPMP